MSSTEASALEWIKMIDLLFAIGGCAAIFYCGAWLGCLWAERRHRPRDCEVCAARLDQEEADQITKLAEDKRHARNMAGYQ